VTREAGREDEPVKAGETGLDDSGGRGDVGVVCGLAVSELNSGYQCRLTGLCSLTDNRVPTSS
jgi:hypothetical protein